MRALVLGEVRDEAGAPVKGAKVCAEASALAVPDGATHEPPCSFTDDDGRYRLASLVPADYVIYAAATGFRPTVYQAGENDAIALRAGEVRGSVDLVLRRGGVEVTGRVLDISGGPVPHAHVRASTQRQVGFGAVAESNAQGEYSLWGDRGPIWVQASADGYAPNRALGRAPGVVDILLTPESSLTGTVVDAATKQPVEGALVEVRSATWSGYPPVYYTTDEPGRFRAARLTPGRYVASATNDHGYGRTEGSTLVGLGTHVDGVVIKLLPAWRVSGKIVIASTQQPCAEGSVSLFDATRDSLIALRRESDGQYIAFGVPPGSYALSVNCRGFVPSTSGAPLVIEDRDLLGLVWRVEAGGEVRGKVFTRAGEPVEGARVLDAFVGGEASERAALDTATSGLDGSYRLRGLKRGTHRITVETLRGVAPREGIMIEMKGAVLERDLVIDDGGTVIGTVVDNAGTPLAGLDILAIGSNGAWSFERGTAMSDARGGFRFEQLRPGDYRITASRGWGDVLRRPGTTDDTVKGEPTTVRADETSTVRLVVESHRGMIRGTVVDANGGSVIDAFVTASRESDAAGAESAKAASTRDDWWGTRAQPVLTNTDGSFTFTQLPAGAFTVRAFRKGGGDASAEHVTVGAAVRLQLLSTGSLAGIARRPSGPPPRDLKVLVHATDTGFDREEAFYMTGGRFAVRDLAGGHLDLTFTAEGGQKALAVELAPGQSRTDLDITLDPLVTLSGRLIDDPSQKPIGSMYVFTGPARESGYGYVLDLDLAEVSDADGRFVLRDVPTGARAIRVVPKDPQASEYASFVVIRDIAGTIDLGDLQLVKRRTRPGGVVGELGLRFVEQPADMPARKRAYQIRWIDPAGPAARTALQLGDVITSCDGFDVTGEKSTRWEALVRAPPGTKLVLGTRRGATAALVLAPP